VFDLAHTVDIALDLPAYDRLVRVLVERNQVDKAREVLAVVMAKKQVVPQEQTFQPVLLKMMAMAQYDAVVALIGQGRANGVQFTFEVCFGRMADCSTTCWWSSR
jgi:hypothetical protein